MMNHYLGIIFSGVSRNSALLDGCVSRLCQPKGRSARGGLWTALTASWPPLTENCRCIRIMNALRFLALMALIFMKHVFISNNNLENENHMEFKKVKFARWLSSSTNCFGTSLPQEGGALPRGGWESMLVDWEGERLGETSGEVPEQSQVPQDDQQVSWVSYSNCY